MDLEGGHMFGKERVYIRETIVSLSTIPLSPVLLFSYVFFPCQAADMMLNGDEAKLSAN